MKLAQVMKKLESLGNEQTWNLNAKAGAGDAQFGVKLGDIRNVAKEIETNHELTAERVAKSSDGLDAKALLDRIEAEMGDVDPVPLWTMNFCLIAIGIHLPTHRKRALAIGEKLGVLRDYPVSKGCTSPFAPIAIDEMVKRQG